MIVAYLLSLVFAIGYGYFAAYNKRLEAPMLAVLDILQSIPVLSFLPGVMLAMVSLFPSRQLGVEFGSIVLIFTGQVWNMAFSFYASLKALPRELVEASRVYRFGRMQRFLQLELPQGAIGLVWNSMVSVAGRLVLPDGMRNVRAGQTRFSAAGTGVVPAIGRQRGRHCRDHLGHRRDDRRGGADRSVGMAASHRVVRQVQTGASGEFQRAFVARSSICFANRLCWAACVTALRHRSWSACTRHRRNGLLKRRRSRPIGKKRSLFWQALSPCC